MLKSLLTPLLIALCLGSTFYYTTANRSAQPVTVAPVPSGGTSGGTITAQAQQPPPPPLPPTRLPDVDAMIVIDNSGSMFGHKCHTHEDIPANDRDQLRIQGADLIVGALAADLKPRETTLGIVTFGDEAILVRPLTRLSNEDPTIRSDLAAAIKNPPCQGDTNIAAAIRMAQQELRSERATPGNAPAIIFLTDGNPTQGGTLGDLKTTLNDLGDVQFFAVILGTDPQLNQSKQFWRAQSEQHPNVTYYELQSSEGITPLYNILTGKLNQVDVTGNPPLPPGQRVTVSVPGNVRQAVMKVIKRAPNVPVSIQDPSGADPHRLPPDRFRALLNNSTVEVYVIERPSPGNWVFSVPDGEVLTVLQPEYRSIYEVQLLQPDSYGLLSVDQPTKIVVQVGDIDSKQLLTDVFTVTGTFREQGQPESVGQPMVLSAGPATSQYNAQIPTGTFAQNQQYILSFLVQDAAGLGSQPTIYQIPAGRLPMISSLNAAPLSVFVDEPIRVTVQVSNTDVISGTPLMSLAPLPDVMGTAFQSADQITYQATLPPLKRPGTYVIGASFRGQTTAGRDFSSADSVTVVVRERWWMIALRYLSLAASLLTGGYLICRFVLLCWLIPFFQKIGISPQGYICTISPEGYKNEEQNLRNVLCRKRKFRTLTVGVGSRFDIPLEPPSNPSDQDDDAAPRKRPGLWERLWGPKAPARITRRGASTVLVVGTGAGSTFTNGAGSRDVVQSTIEYSLKSMTGDDDQS